MNGFVQRAINRLMMRRPSRTFFVCILLVCFAACNAGVRRSGIPAGAQTALQNAIDDIDAGRYDKLYQEASDEWRKQSSQEDSRATLQKMRDKLGRARTRDLQTAREGQTSTGPVPGHSVTVIYQTTFDRTTGTPPKPITGMETFTLIEQGGGWFLAKYYVSSTELR